MTAISRLIQRNYHLVERVALNGHLCWHMIRRLERPFDLVKLPLDHRYQVERQFRLPSLDQQEWNDSAQYRCGLSARNIPLMIWPVANVRWCVRSDRSTEGRKRQLVRLIACSGNSDLRSVIGRRPAVTARRHAIFRCALDRDETIRIKHASDISIGCLHTTEHITAGTTGKLKFVG